MPHFYRTASEGRRLLLEGKRHILSRVPRRSRGTLDRICLYCWKERGIFYQKCPGYAGALLIEYASFLPAIVYDLLMLFCRNGCAFRIANWQFRCDISLECNALHFVAALPSGSLNCRQSFRNLLHLRREPAQKP